MNVLMIGTGEYTTGYVGGGAADSDKGAGVVALTMFDLRRRGKVDRIAMCGVNVRYVTFLRMLFTFECGVDVIIVAESVPNNLNDTFDCSFFDDCIIRI